MKLHKYFSALVLSAFIISCGNHKSDKQEIYDTPDQGTIRISVDESFQPVIEQQLQMYADTYPNSHIIASYKSEADCFRDLQNDSTRMIVVARGLKEEESQFYLSKLRFRPTYTLIAYDAVSAVINKSSNDSLFTMKDLKDILSGKNKKRVVVDGNNATSSVRFLLDSVLRGASFGPNVEAAKGSKAVLNYITTDANAIGFVGSSWIGNDEDPEQASYAKSLRFALLECPFNCDPGTYAKPSQATLTYGQYPLRRELYAIVKENTLGLGSGFLGFMTGERGQLIFRRAYLVPGKISFNVRNGKIE